MAHLLGGKLCNYYNENYEDFVAKWKEITTRLQKYM